MPLPGVVDAFGVPPVDPWDELGQLIAQPPIAPDPVPSSPPEQPIHDPPSPPPVAEAGAPPWAPSDIAGAFMAAPPVPDATSGAAPLPEIPDAITGAAPIVPPPPPTEPDGRSWFHSPLWEASKHDLALEYSTDPAAVALHGQELEQERQSQLTTEKADALQHSAQAALDNQRILRDATAQSQRTLAEVDAESKKLAAQKIGWASKSAPQKVLGVISAVIGGLYQARHGGPNVGVDIINQTIEQELAEHRMKLEQLNQRRSNAAGDMGRAVDTFRTQEVMRQSMLEIAAQQAEQHAAQFDPRGTSFQRASELAVALRQQAAAAGQKFAADEFKRWVDLGELGIKKGELAVKQRAQQLAESKAALAGGGPKTDTLIQPADAKRIYGIEIERPMKMGEVNARLEGLGKAQGLAAGANTTGLSKEQLERAVPGLEIETVGPDGQPTTQPFLAVGGPDESKKLRGAVTSTKQLVRLMDEVVRFRAESGWQPDIYRSERWRQMKTNWADAIGKAKGDGVLALGVLTGPDMDLVGDFLGTKDPTEFRDPTAGIKKARDNLLNDVNDQAEGLAPPGARVKRFDIKYIPPTPPVVSKDDEAFKKYASKTANSEAEDAAYMAHAGPGGTGGGVDASTAKASAPLGAGPQSYVDGLAAEGAKGDKKALEHLTNLANGADHPAVKAYAQQRLNGIITHALPPTTTETVR